MTANTVYKGAFSNKFKDAWLWVCARYPKCDAYVGCHPGTQDPLGRLADRELRKAKVAAHAAFDRLWRAKIEIAKTPRKVARTDGYKWLAKKLGVPLDSCHIGMFDVRTCNKVVEICSPYLRGQRMHSEQGAPNAS